MNLDLAIKISIPAVKNISTPSASWSVPRAGTGRTARSSASASTAAGATSSRGAATASRGGAGTAVR